MEAIPIWGAIASSIVVTNVVKGWIAELVVFLQEYNEAGETLQRFRERYEMSAVNLMLWRDMWAIDENVSKRYTRELWGKTANQAIVGCLGSITRRNNDIQNTFTKFLNDLGLNPFRNAANIWANPDQKKRKLTTKKTISFVAKSCSKLTRDLEFIEDQTKVMMEMAKNAFKIKRGMAISSGSVSKADLGDIKKTILYQLAFETRLASKGLYKSCFAACKIVEARSTKIHLDAIKAIKLEIDILRRVAADMEMASSKEAIALQYQLLVSWPTKLIEISIEGPLIPEKSPRPSNGFFGACIKALSDEPEIFQVPDMPEPAWFRSQVPHKTQRIPSEPQLKPLSSLLHELDIPTLEEPLETFPRSERIRLAFKLAECGLFLLGTPWLSGLKVDLIQRSVYNMDRRRRFLLATEVSKEEISENEFKQFAQQAFAIGVLLLELGCGRLVDEIPKRSKTEGQGFLLHSGRLEHLTPTTFVSGPRINEILVSTMGDEYANAVKVCLQSNESLKNAVKVAAPDRRKLYQGILADYYLGVFLPLKSVQDIIEWDMGS